VLTVDELETVVRQMAFEKAARLRLDVGASFASDDEAC
jgi:hypothetical protein